MSENRGYIAFELTEASRKLVLERFPPRFAVVRADHVTYLYGVDSQLPTEAQLEVVAYASEPGLEALVVAVDGETKRADGSIYHLTLSRDEGRSSVESNALVARENAASRQPVEKFSLDAQVVFRLI